MAVLPAIILQTKGQVISRIADTPFVVDDDGAWCWFQDERALVLNNTLYIGSVASGWQDAQRTGDVQVSTFDLVTETRRGTYVLHKGFELDDHDAPALQALNDGRVLAAYSKHTRENAFYYRMSSTTRGTWGPEQSWKDATAAHSRLAYNNLVFLKHGNESHGRLFNFLRGLQGDIKPSFVYSDDVGATWKNGGIFIRVPPFMEPRKMRQRPYVKYASDGRDVVHFLFTEAHPSSYDTSVYHMVLRDGKLFTTNGSYITTLKRGIDNPAAQASLVFRGDTSNVAWVSDIHLDERGQPVGVFSVRRHDPRQQVPKGADIRYRYARWNGTAWNAFEVARGGSCLYAEQFDYSGNIALDPKDLSKVFFSSNVHPISGDLLISRSDGRQHYEIFQGVTRDAGITWSLTSITANSSEDNIRPIVPVTKDSHLTALLWLRGRYVNYTDYALKVFGVHV